MSDQYIIKRGVPIVDEHVMYDDQGDPLVRVDEAVLHKIAAKNNDRVRLTGDEVPITIGHTQGDPGEYVPEEKQPDIVGYARDFRVAPFFRTGKKCVTATFKLLRRYAARIAKHPRRSIEIWLGDWKVDPISLLGATTPSRDLGLLRLAADGRKVYRRVLPHEKNMENQELVEAVLKALEQTDVWQYMKSKMDEDEAGQDGLDGEPGLSGEGEGEGLPPEGDLDQSGPPPAPEDDSDGGDEYGDLGQEQEEGRAPVRMSGAACASGTNTMPPGTGRGRKPARKPEPARYQASGDRIRLSRVEAENVGLRKAVNGMRVRLARAERERDLTALMAEGYEFDLREELDDVQALDDAQYARHLGRIKARYSRSLTSTQDWHAASRSPNAALTNDQKEEVADYAIKKGISFGKALQELGLE